MPTSRRLARTAFLAASCASLLLALPTQAAVQLTVNGGILEGATGVVVNGTSYDVSFQDGTCTALFSPCSGTSTFAFTTEADATAAAVALFNQVLIDGPAGNFDSKPDLTRGCTLDSYCSILTPYGVDPVFGSVSYAGADNESVDPNAVFSSTYPSTFSTASNVDITWAVWSQSVAAPVPEPSSMGMAALGLLVVAGAAGRIRRR